MKDKEIKTLEKIISKRRGQILDETAIAEIRQEAKKNGINSEISIALNYQIEELQRGEIAIGMIMMGLSRYISVGLEGTAIGSRKTENGWINLKLINIEVAI